MHLLVEWRFSAHYSKNPKNSAPEKFAVIILKVEQFGFMTE